MPGLTTLEAVHLVCTFLAVALFLGVGAVLRRSASSRQAVNPEARLSPLHRLVKRSRPSRVQVFKTAAEGILTDAIALEQSTQGDKERRALLPLVVEIRRQGERLSAESGVVHRVLFPQREKALHPLIQKLIILERSLKSLPRSELTIEDVLEGRFDTKQLPRGGIKSC